MCWHECAIERFDLKKFIIVSDIQNSKSQIRLPLILAVALAGGVLIGATMVKPDNPVAAIFNSASKFKEVLNHVERSYVDEVDSDKLVEDAIIDMLDKLDPHSSYIPSRDLELVSSQLQGNFEGIGIQFDIIRDTIYVITPLSGGPSEKLGLQAGDKIITVDGENVAGVDITSRGVMDRLRGPKGSQVKVELLRKNEADLVPYVITRDEIPQYSVDVSYMVDDEIGYLKVSRFSSTTYDEFRTNMNKLLNSGMKKLILDLQGNPGGYMNAAINMADEMIAGNELIVSQSSREPRYNSKSFAKRKGMFEKGPIIVLINEGSASASEIVSGALQDNDRALIVGRRSFGKGLVQMPMPLSDGAELRLTIARYYTPSGRSIQKPYDDSELDNYRSDISNRYANGEFFHADSIKFADSLKFKTRKGRVVYGGGGIMPDYFVPFDTAMTTPYYRALFRSNAVREFTLQYYDGNKGVLTAQGLEDFTKEFEVTDAMIRKITRIGEEVGVDYNAEELKISKALLKVQVKAQIARSVWGEEGFFPIFNQTDEIFQQALMLFEEAERLALAN